MNTNAAAAASPTTPSAPRLPFDPVAMMPVDKEHTERDAARYGEAFEFRRFDGDVIYPAVLKAIQEGAKSTTPDAIKYDPMLEQVRAMPDAIKDALLPLGEAEEEQEETVTRGGQVVETKKVKVKVPVPPTAAMTPERRQAREFVLEVARMWFTNELHNALKGARLGIHIVKNLRWKL